MKPRIISICIYPKDIQGITGRSERYSRDLIHKIRKSLNKEDHQVVTIEELSIYLASPYHPFKPSSPIDTTRHCEK